MLPEAYAWVQVSFAHQFLEQLRLPVDTSYEDAKHSSHGKPEQDNAHAVSAAAPVLELEEPNIGGLRSSHHVSAHLDGAHSLSSSRDLSPE